MSSSKGKKTAVQNEVQIPCGRSKNKQNGFQTKLSQYFKDYNLPLLGFGFCYSKLLKLKSYNEGCLRYLQIWKYIE